MNPGVMKIICTTYVTYVSEPLNNLAHAHNKRLIQCYGSEFGSGLNLRYIGSVDPNLERVIMDPQKRREKVICAFEELKVLSGDIS